MAIPVKLDEELTKYASREEARASFLAEAEASWKDYQETGLHLTGDEVEAWLATWGMDAETDAPACHT